jgi:hypothetical protein
MASGIAAKGRTLKARKPKPCHNQTPLEKRGSGQAKAARVEATTQAATAGTTILVEISRLRTAATNAQAVPPR